MIELNEEEEEEEEEEMMPRFIPKSERILSNQEKEKKIINKKIINKNQKEIKENKNIKDIDNKKEDLKNKNDYQKDKGNAKNCENSNSENEEEKARKQKEKEENDILKNNILSIRTRLDKIHQQNIKYLIELEKKKNSQKKQNIINLDEDGENPGKNKLLIGKQKKLKSQQEKI